MATKADVERNPSADADFLASIVSSSDDAIEALTLDGKVLVWNRGSEELYGYRSLQMVGKSVLSVYPEDRADELKKILSRIKVGDHVEPYATKRIRKDGSLIDVAISASPIADNDGKIVGVSVISRPFAGGDLLFLASIISSSDDAIEALTLDGKVLVWNRGSEELYGHHAGQMVGKSVLSVYPEDRADELKKIIAKIKEGAHVEPYVTKRTKKDGSLIDVAVSASPIKNNKGEIVGISVISRPFAGQERVAQYARSLIEASLDPLVTISVEGKITDVNEATVQVTGIGRSQLIGSDFSTYFTEPDKAREGYRLVFSKGKVTDYPLTIRHKDGRLTDVLYNASVYKDDTGNVLGVFAAARDVTAQKQASQYARSLIEASLDPLVTISTEGKITDVNEATVQVTGVSREKLIDSDFSTYFTDPDEASRGYQRVFKEGKVTDYPLTIRHKDGRLTDVLYNASVYKDEAGNVLGIFAAARDVTVQKQASRYARSLIEASLDPLVTISTEGKITDVNEATVQVTGVSREKLIGSDFSTYFTDPDEARQGYQQVFKEGLVRDYPLTIRHQSGSLTDVLYNASVYKDEKGNVLGIFAAARDVTARKKVEEQLHATSAYARSLIEASLDPQMTISSDGKITDVNHATELIAGVSREWLIGSEFPGYFTEPRKAREGYRKVLKDGSVSNYPLALKHASGRVVDVLFNATVYRDASGKVQGIFAAARDVTETKKAAQYARSLIEASLDPLVTISAEGKITDVNEATIKATGIPREKLIGTDFSDYFAQPEKAREGYLQVFKKGFVTDYPLTIRQKSGALTDVLYNASVYKDEKGNVLGVFAAARDNTQTKRAAEQLETTNKDLEAFSYSVSHDLRAPLRAIDGFSKILMEDYGAKLDAEGKRVIAIIRDNAMQMGKLIDDLLQFSRLGRQEMQKSNIDMTDLAKAIFDDLKKGESKREISFASGTLPDAFADPTLIHQVWVNLLSNALKYTRRKKSTVIEVSAKTENGSTVYSVKDNGAGFDPRYGDKLFGVFQRLHSTDEFEGTGVGLAIVKRVIARHGGTVKAEGKPSEGATFSFSLPTAKLNVK
jgi:PAS domain S-box-containing protein